MKPGESFASWIQRTSFSNGLKVSDLFPGKSHPHRKYGWRPYGIQENQLFFLSRVLDLPTEEIEQRMQDDYLLATTRFCPACLKEHQCYFKSWQDMETLRCEVHQVMLLGECPTCRAEVKSYTKVLQRKSAAELQHDFVSCGICKTDLTGVESVPDHWPEETWTLAHALMKLSPHRPPPKEVTVTVEGRAWPLQILWLLWNEIFLHWRFGESDLLNWVQKTEQHDPNWYHLGDKFRFPTEIVRRCDLLRQLLQHWPWKMSSFLRRMAFIVDPFEHHSRLWVDQVISRYIQRLDPVLFLHVDCMLEYVRTEYLDEFVPRYKRELPNHRMILWHLEDLLSGSLPVIEGGWCSCQVWSLEQGFNWLSKRRTEAFREVLDAW